jgi:hypothetical protein
MRLCLTFGSDAGASTSVLMNEMMTCAENESCGIARRKGPHPKTCDDAAARERILLVFDRLDDSPGDIQKRMNEILKRHEIDPQEERTCSGSVSVTLKPN